MSILLAAATAKEISPFLGHYRQSDSQQDIDILITGIGLAAATYAITKQVHIKRPRLVIQAGIAGCFDRNIPLGSVFVVSQEAVADLGVKEDKQFKTLFDIGLIKANRPPYYKSGLVNPGKDLIKKAKLKPVKGITVNQITTSKQVIRQYRDKFNPVIESMEGAALHYVCLMEKIPFLQLRSISNYVGERNKKKWDLQEAITGLNKVLTGIINNN